VKVPTWLKSGLHVVAREALHYAGTIARTEFEVWLRRRTERVDVLHEVRR
jgi:hypothetical protein